MWKVSGYLVIYLIMTFASVPDILADGKDSLRSILLTDTLNDSARVVVLEQLMLLYSDTNPDTALFYTEQAYKTILNRGEKNSTDKRIVSATLTVLQRIRQEREMLLGEREKQYSSLQWQQTVMSVCIVLLVLFAILMLIPQARRVLWRRGKQFEQMTENPQEQARTQSAHQADIVKFKHILDESTDYIVMSDAGTGKILYMNKAYQTLIGIDAPPETLEELTRTVYTPELAEKMLRESIPYAIEHGRLTNETVLLDAKGGQVLVLQTTICHKNEDDSSVILSSIMRDVTEYKRQEQVLKESNAHLRSLLHLAPFAIAVTRRSDGKPLFNNAYMQNINGLSPNIDEHPYAREYYQYPQDRARTLEELTARGRVDRIELALKKPGGGEHWWALLSMVPIDFEGEPALFSAFQDITIRKNAEEFLHHSNEEISRQKDLLEEQARDIELANSQLESINNILEDRNKQLEELDREKNEILGIVTHDLKNPIAAIRGLAELLSGGMLGVEQLATIYETIIQTADRMMILVKNLLDINRLESGAMVLHITEFDVLPFVEHIVEQYSHQADVKKIALQYLSERSAGMILADEQATLQVLDNIISNAVKYSPHGKNIFVRVKASDKAVRIEVQDEGPGISEDDMKKLFGKFIRLSSRPTGGEHSTGLGLSIVKKMVEAMNGRVWCESEVGKGATFIVELPIVE